MVALIVVTVLIILVRVAAIDTGTEAVADCFEVASVDANSVARMLLVTEN